MSKFSKLLVNKERELERLSKTVHRLKEAVAKEKQRERDAQLQAAEPWVIGHGGHVCKVWPGRIHLVDDVRLQSWGQFGGIVYEYVAMTGDEEEDRFRRGSCQDMTSPTFIRKEAARRWNRLARAMNSLLDKERIVLVGKPKRS